MGELLDKLIGMQEKSDKMMMELEIKRAQLEEKQMDMQMRREERQFQLQMVTRNSHSTLPPGPSCPAYGYGGYDPDATQDDLL